MMRGWVVVVVCLVAMPAWVDQAWADEAGVITTHATARTRIANTVADAAGLALGPVRRIDVEPGGARGRPAPMMAMGRAAMRAAPMATEAMATEAGDTEVEATVAVAVAISGGLAGR